MGKIKRRKTRLIKVGNVKIGGKSPISVQSMTNTDTKDIKATVKQIKELEKAGCEIIRVAAPDMESAKAIKKIKRQINIPLVADIHFDYRIAIESINQGADKVRINPGNIGGSASSPRERKKRVKAIVEAAKERNIPIRIGINSGSLEWDLLKKYQEKVPAEALVESALRSIRLLEGFNFKDIVVALKSTDVLTTVRAYEILAKKGNWPFHLGITEAGRARTGIVKSSIGIGSLLLKGIGDTIRVSLSGPPLEEVKVGWEILKDLSLRERGLTVISCPTCARTKIPVAEIAEYIEGFSDLIKKPTKIAVMGCLPKGIPIIANPMLKPIEEVQINDRVLTHFGKFQKVIQVFKRYYRGNLIEIQPRGFPSFLVTPEHPIQAMPRPRISKNKQKLIAVSRTIGQKNPRWIKANMLSKEWILTYPIIKGSRDVKDYKGIKIDKDFLTICGYYLSEGSLSGRNGRPYQVHFDFHQKEKSYYLNLKQSLNRYNTKLHKYARPSKKTLSTYISSLFWGSLLLKLFGKRAEKKHMPYWFLTLPPKKQVHLLKTLWEGDGYIGKVRGYWRASYVTTSLLLAFQVHQLLLRQGIAASILSMGPRPGHQKSYAITVTGKYYLNRFFQMLRLNVKLGEISQRKQHIAVDGNFLYAPIFRIRTVPYKGVVYNLKVTKDHSYVTFGASLHNCIVNGLGEARHADLAIVGLENKKAGVFKKGKFVKNIQPKEIKTFLKRILWEKKNYL